MPKSAILSQECPELASYSLPLTYRSPSNFAKGLIKQRRGDDSYKDDALEDLVPQVVRKHGSFDSHQRQSTGVMEVDKNNEAPRSTDT